MHFILTSFAVFLYQCFANTKGSSVDFLNEATFQSSIVRSPHFVLFYAPWCGHCKTLLAPWNQLAEKSQAQDEGIRVKIAKVNCMEDTALCSEENILAYPTMKLYNKGVIRRFDGRRTILELESFIKKTLNEEMDVEEHEGLVTLTTETFDGHIRTGLHFVEFYAPWCVHCKHFEPTWKAIAKHFEQNPDITICKMDCTVEMSKCQELKITGFPMLKLFKDGAEIDNYNAERRMEILLAYINDNLYHYGLSNVGGQRPEKQKFKQTTTTPKDDEDDTPPQNIEDIDSAELNPVVEVIDKTFDMLLDDPIFIMFYVPWCKYCQRLKPTWESLGKRCQQEGLPIIARMDCSKFTEICEKNQVYQYPTLIFFKGRQRHYYNGDRKLESLYKFVRSFHDEL